MSYAGARGRAHSEGMEMSGPRPGWAWPEITVSQEAGARRLEDETTASGSEYSRCDGPPPTVFHSLPFPFDVIMINMYSLKLFCIQKPLHTFRYRSHEPVI